MNAAPKKIWGGFWQRLFAFILDYFFLALFLIGIGTLFYDYFASLGSNGRLYGLGIGIVYFGVLSSRYGGGRTLGQGLMGLKVVGVDAKPLGLFASLWRATLLVTPFMINGVYFFMSNHTIAYILTALIFTIVTGVSLAQFYLLIFNHPTRRLVHDYLTASVVVRNNTKEFTIPKGKLHYNIASILILITLILGFGAPIYFKNSRKITDSNLDQIVDVRRKINDLPNVVQSAFLDNINYQNINGKKSTSRSLIVTVHVTDIPENPKPLAAKIGSMVVKAYRFAPNQKLIIRIAKGYDLGFVNANYTIAIAYSPQCPYGDERCLIEDVVRVRKTK